MEPCKALELAISMEFGMQNQQKSQAHNSTLAIHDQRESYQF